MARSDPPTTHPCDALSAKVFWLFLAVIGFALLTRLLSAGVFLTVQGVLSLLIFNSFVASLSLGLLIHYWVLPARKLERIAILGGGALLELLLGLHRFRHTDWIMVVVNFGVGLGIAALFLGFLPRFARAGSAAEKARLRRSFYSPMLILFSYFVGHFTVGLVAILNPTVYDLYGYAIDRKFGPSLAFVVASAMIQWPLLGHGLRIVYGFLAIPMVLSQVKYLLNPRKHYADPTVCFVFLGTLGGALYFAFPMVGAAAFFSKVFPFYQPDVIEPQSLVFSSLEAPRRCLPSLHGAWALSCCWLNWNSKGWFRYGSLLFLALTIPAALSTGHYLMDLVLSFPLTLWVHALVVWLSSLHKGSYHHPVLRRTALQAVAWGACMMLGSIYLLRAWPGIFLNSTAFCYAWTVTLVAASWYLDFRVQKLAYQRLGQESTKL